MLQVDTQHERKYPVEMAMTNRKNSVGLLKIPHLISIIAFLTLFPMFVLFFWSPPTHLEWLMLSLAYGGFVVIGLLVIWKFYFRSIFHGVQMIISIAGGKDSSLESMAKTVSDRIKTIETSFQRLDLIVSELPQGVLVFNHEGILLEINQAGAQMLGLFSLQDNELISIAAKRLNECGINVVLERALNHGKFLEKDVRIEYSGPRWLQAQSRPFKGIDDKDGVLIILNEVTRLRQLEDVRRDFVANVSHEFRTPITSITGFVETLIDNKMWNDAEAEHFLNIIHKHSIRLGGIIDDLLSLAHIEIDEQKTIAFADSAVAPAISLAIEPLSQVAASQDITIKVICEPDLTCRMNSHLIEQALTNLIDNAIKFSNQGSKIIISAQRSLEQVKISVIDDGVGISLEHQERIFERFYRIDRSRNRNRGGTGLGLSIVKHIVQAHGGEVSVKSSENSGTNFTLIFPD